MSGLGEGDTEMKKKANLLACCGFYCGDCLGHTGVIADAAEELKNVLQKYRFDRTAKCMFPDRLRNYNRFFEILKFMTGLRCGKVCREREDTGISCVVRKCCREHGFYACYECGDLKICEKLKSLNSGLHYDSYMKNFEAIKEMGLENWIIRGKQFHYWDEQMIAYNSRIGSKAAMLNRKTVFRGEFDSRRFATDSTFAA